MFKGYVAFTAAVVEGSVTFPPFKFTPPHLNVESAELEGQSGDQLSGTVSISSVATASAGMNLARTVIDEVLNRLAFLHGLAIEPPRVTRSEFSPVSPPPGHHLLAGTGHYFLTGQRPRVLVGISSDTLKVELEKANPPGEVNFSHFRSARLSVGPVEEYMHLYAILLTLLGDSQTKVDAFIVSAEPSVKQTQSPGRRVLETAYTRLRNEFAHKRPGTSVDAAKVRMASQLGSLRGIVKRAIIQCS